MRGVHAWLTSAANDKAAKQALILAASLHRVQTAKQLVIIVAPDLSRELFQKLKDAFDLTITLDHKAADSGFDLEDYAKIQGFSLKIFTKIVYLAPRTLVLRNCDDLLEKDVKVGMTGMKGQAGSTDVYIFTPSTRWFGMPGSIARETTDKYHGHGRFTGYLEEFVRKSNVCCELLGEECNVRISLKECLEESDLYDGVAVIANFVDTYPLELYENGLNITTIPKIGHFGKADLKLDIDRPLRTPQRGHAREPIAIVGLNFRLPGGNTPEEFWNLLVNGREGIKPLPTFRWKKEHSYFPCKNRRVEAGFLDMPIDQFDGKFFGVSPKEAVFLDPQQRLLHEVSWHALEDAGIDPTSLQKTQTGFFVGSWIHDYKELTVRRAEVDFFRTYMGNSIAATAARLSHFLGTTGPSIATESACSSSIVAVDMACKSLLNHDSNLALACGVNLLLHPFHLGEVEMVVSPDGRCKTFDVKANGFGRAEGCAVLVLQRLSDAVRDGSKIWGLIRGSAVTQEGLSKSLGTPTIHCEALAMELALKDASVEAEEVSYIEAHGTGTPVGDPLEVAAIAQVYSGKRDIPLRIGSVKTNVGHTESASGITGIIKVLLSLKHDTIPPNRNLDTLNPNINLSVIPAEIPLQPVPWLKPASSNKPRRIAGVSSFGISGTDGHVIIEEAPATPISNIDFSLERPLHIMKISAKSQESMDKLLKTYERIFREKEGRTSSHEFADLAHSANIGRATFNHRAVVVAKDFEQATHILESKTFKCSEVSRKHASICFLFTGQGSQYPNMASTLYSTSHIFRLHFDKCSEILEKSYNIPIKKVLWGNGTDVEELNRTLFSQTCIFCVEYALLKLWESWGVQPDFVLGHSLGEFAAAVAAGALSLKDALMLVAERSRLIDNLPKGKMLVIRADKKSVEKEIAKYQKFSPDFWADFAALNSSDQTVIAGDSQMIQDFAKHCQDNSIKAIVLASTHAFHSRHMDQMLDDYRKIAMKVNPFKVAKNSPKYISGMEGKLMDAEEIDGEYWVKHTRDKVNFIEACKSVQSQECCTIFLEIGPHPILSALMMHNLEQASPILCLPSIRREEPEWTTLLSSLSTLYLSEWKGTINWKGFDQFYNRSRVELPLYPFNRKSVWIKSERKRVKLHPLLGNIYPNASNQTIFESCVAVKKNTEFLQDHVIGSTIIFPGAGFLELILAGGYASVQGLTEEWTMPRRAIAVSNVRIVAPLAMSDSEVSFIQTVVTLEEKEGTEPSYSVSVYRNTDSSGQGQWFLHSTGTFHPVVQKKPAQLSSNVDIFSIKNSWEQHDKSDFYEKLPGLGLHFGEKFRSLHAGWDSEAGQLAEVRIPEEDRGSYLIHPLLTDAMLQALMLYMTKGNVKKLQVPVKIGEFIWLSAVDSKDQVMYVYCSKNDDDGVPYSLMLDENGIVLAYMSDVDFAETSAKLIEGMVQQQSTVMPGLWQDVWKEHPGPCQNRLDLCKVDFPTKLSTSTEQLLGEHNELPPEEQLFRKNLSELTHYLFLRGLFRLGWNPQGISVFKLEHLLKSLSILDVHRSFVRFFLRDLVKTGLLKYDDKDSEFSFVGSPPTFEHVSERTHQLINEVDRTRTALKLILEIGNILHETLTGKTSPLSVLFPQDSSKVNAGDIYRSGAEDLQQTFFLTVDNFVFDSILREIERKIEETSEAPFIRILEVGAGTGMLSQLFLNFLSKKGIKFKYYYTDVSPAFFSAAERALGENARHVVFKKFDMEKDPLEQGFSLEYFDVILAVETIHISKNVTKTLRNLRGLLRPGGVVFVEETIIEDPKITFMFGLLEGYWGFEDAPLREFHPTLTPEKWTEVLHSANFPRVEWRPAVGSTHGIIIGWASDDNENLYLEESRERRNAWLIFEDGTDLSGKISGKLDRVNRQIVTIPKPTVFTEVEMKREIKCAIKKVMEAADTFEGVIYLWGLTGREDRDQSHVSLPLLTLLQLLPTCQKVLPKLVVVTQGIFNVHESQVVNPSGGTLRGILGSVKNENISWDITHLDLCPNQHLSSQVDELFCHLFWVEQSDIVSIRNGKRFLPKFASAKIQNDNELPLPRGCHRFQLQLPETRLISDLEFVSLGPYELEEIEVEMEVKAVALNFRDVFAVLKPTPEFEELYTIGVDMAGVITKIGSKVTNRQVGDRIIGLSNKNLAIPSHATMRASHTIALPIQMTYAEGSTLIIPFSTALLCLVEIGKIKEGETVLIHTASGGVGLAAIQVANYFRAKVIATAGSERKRSFLRNQLGIQHVFNSRTTDFGKEILEVTGGQGVDIVLNSLTGPGFKEASLGALAQNGRFIEMNKLNVWTKEEVKQLRPDVLYEVPDLSYLDADEYTKMIAEVEKLLENNSIAPIPYERFDAVNIRGALAHLQKAKHIGKIVCIMPEVKVDKAKVIGTSPLFNESSTYLVTGGLGGIGFEVVKWILGNGGKHVAIASRSKPNSGVEAEISSWNRGGLKHVEAFQLDVGDFEKCRQLLDHIASYSSFPPLRGVMHAAGVLENGLVENQSWEMFEKTYNPKVSGSWNLHDLTKNLQLEHFVLFSSLAATFGSPGQANHSASNSFEDALAHFRNSMGLPVISINWGNWGEVGVAADTDFPGVRPISTSQAFHALEKFLKTQTTHISVLNVESFPLLLKLFPAIKTYINDKNLKEMIFLGFTNVVRIDKSFILKLSTYTYVFFRRQTLGE